MDNKTLVASYVAKESERLNQSVKDIMSNGLPPTSEQKDALLLDMETTLAKLTSALEYLSLNMANTHEEEELPVA